MMWGYGYGPAGMGLFGGGLMMLFWIAVLVGVVLLVARGFRHGAVGCCGTPSRTLMLLLDVATGPAISPRSASLAAR